MGLEAVPIWLPLLPLLIPDMPAPTLIKLCELDVLGGPRTSSLTPA